MTGRAGEVERDMTLYKQMPDVQRIGLLRSAGCSCPTPLLGWRPMVGPRCRLCNTEATADA